MPLLQVRDCPEDIYRKIAVVAKQEKRTVAQQIVVLLERSLGLTQSNAERRRQLLDKIRSRDIPSAAKEIDEVALIREDRDR